jgi:hypothetical protein
MPQEKLKFRAQPTLNRNGLGQLLQRWRKFLEEHETRTGTPPRASSSFRPVRAATKSKIFLCSQGARNSREPSIAFSPETRAGDQIAEER